MAKTWIEISLLSARGLRRTSSLWKLQWFAVGWIDPDNKYCTKIDATGTGNPVWKTKFATAIDHSKDVSGFQDLVLHVEVRSLEPIFLRERLQGTTTVVLKEFLKKYNVGESDEISKPVEETGSFQLRKRNSNKCRGFVDVSIRVSQEREEHAGSSTSGGHQDFALIDSSGGINLNSGPAPSQNHPSFGRQNHPTADGSTYPPPPTQPPNVGHAPITPFLPRTEVNSHWLREHAAFIFVSRAKQAGYWTWIWNRTRGRSIGSRCCDLRGRFLVVQ
ncbi:hypothetical protein F511_09182 [Dorcoceras hygrometricum]|uniref:C2 domain-containing protein n=1 Tax=Dorcoceras hygrometricum TaxID=472368 RepID=A0A2Z7CYX3_9LAMI|nr:hypothetical protein F511_09182 [Dorcoceras hygrometricum]